VIGDRAATRAGHAGENNRDTRHPALRRAAPVVDAIGAELLCLPVDATAPSTPFVAPLLLFTLITIAWLWPVLRHIGLVVPGAGAGDNLTFVWNTWWMHQVLSGDGSFFRTPLLFAPFGVDLTLHTHTALPSAAAALLFPGSAVVGTNLLIAVTSSLTSPVHMRSPGASRAAAPQPSSRRLSSAGHLM
jgi:hypothetical protein